VKNDFGRGQPWIAYTCAVVLLSSAMAALPGEVSADSGGPDISGISGMDWRFIGPYRGGRVNAVVGHPEKIHVFYAGYTGGGVWRTTDGGHNWENISDGQITTGSIGAIEISRSNPDVLYVGTGEHGLRGDVSHGDGVYKSIDGGDTWTNVGLRATRQIARIVIHPTDSDTVYVAAIGHFAGPNPERGVFRTTDGGATWKRVLFTDENSGAIGLVMDPTRPNVLFAALWDIQRFPWGIRSGGPGTSLHRSLDGGDTWEDITLNSGLPRGNIRERIGLTLSPSKPGRVWAIIKSEVERGLYRSDDDGETWTKTTDDIRIFARAYYYMHIYADPKDADTIWSPGEFLFVSRDAGKTFEEIKTLHDDHHDLWVDGNDNSRLIDGSDGGAMISFNGGKTWSSIFNQPTGQIYTIGIDDRFPYMVFGSQQDWGTIGVSSRPAMKRGQLAGTSFYDPTVSEGGYTQVDPNDPDILYIGDHHWMMRHDRKTGYTQLISPRDDNYYGWGTRDIEYRFFWTFPVLLSKHETDTLYIGSQYVHRTKDGGDSWEVISPDLTAADPRTMEVTPLYGRDVSENGPYWGPLTRDSNGDNWFATIYTIAESPLEKGMLWVGSDDGRVHLTTDGGESWTNVTPRGLPEFATISRIDPSPHDPATAYVAAMRYKLDDYRPMIFKTNDSGASWTEIINGIDDDDFIRVVREDPVRPGMLFAGSETGVYVSFNDGESWQRMQLNLPHVPVYELKIHSGDIVIATHGRGFWIFDDIGVFRQLGAETMASDAHLFAPRTTPRFRLIGRGTQSSKAGAPIRYFLKSPAQEELVINIKEADGNLVRTFEADLSSEVPEEDEDSDDVPVANDDGINTFWWDLRYPRAEDIEGVVTRGSRKIGPYAVPGTYQVELVVDGTSQTQTFDVVRDPRNPATQADLEAQFELGIAIRDEVTEVNRTILDIRATRDEIQALAAGAAHDMVGNRLRKTAADLSHRLYGLEDVLIQFTATFRMEFHAKPVKLNDKLYTLASYVSRGEARPTQAQQALFKEFAAEADAVRDQLAAFKEQELAAYLARTEVAGVQMPEPEGG
jgi:photosystem II stability/assembly factor-like uncharacterized protein